MSMSRSTLLFGRLVASLLLLSLSSAVQAAVGGLSVRVVDATTNRPLAGVAVMAAGIPIYLYFAGKAKE